jgi:hypothetical protein
VVTVDNPLEQGSGLVAQSACIQMNQQEYGQHKSNYHMQYIVKQESADVKYGIGYLFGEHECYPGDNQQGHAQIHGKYIRHFLQGIELLFFGDGEGMRIPFKYANGIKMKLFPEFGPQIFSPFAVIVAITREHITNDKHPKIDCEDDTANIVNGHRSPKRDQDAVC